MRRLQEHSIDGTNGIIDSQNDGGSWSALNSIDPPTDTSSDDMPDDWKQANQSNPSLQQANGRDLDSNFDKVEVYINRLAKEIVAKQQ